MPPGLGVAPGEPLALALGEGVALAEGVTLADALADAVLLTLEVGSGVAGTAIGWPARTSTLAVTPALLAEVETRPLTTEGGVPVVSATRGMVRFVCPPELVTELPVVTVAFEGPAPAGSEGASATIS